VVVLGNTYSITLVDTNDSTMYRKSRCDTKRSRCIVYAYIRDTFVEYVGKPSNALFSQFRNTIRYPVTNRPISHEN